MSTAIALLVHAGLLSAVLATASGGEAPGDGALPSLKNPAQYRFLEPHGVLIFTSDDQVRAVADDPKKPVKGLELGQPDREISLEDFLHRAAGGGQTHVTISFDFFFGGSARELHPMHPDFIRAMKTITAAAAKEGLGVGASVLNPLDFGRDFRALHGAGGEQLEFTEGALAADGSFDLEAPVEETWANNKGPIDLRLREVRAWAFREDPLPGGEYLAVRPESIARALQVSFERLPDARPRHPGGYRQGKMHVRGKADTAGGRNRVLVIGVHETPEMDYFHPEAEPYLKALINRYDREGVRFREFYSDEMHIQFDWDLGAHIGPTEIRTRYLTPSFSAALAPELPAGLAGAEASLVYHGFHEEGGHRTTLQHVLGPDPLDAERTFRMRKVYFESLHSRVVDLCLGGLRYAERLYEFAPSTRAHATWQESPTCDLFCPGGMFQGALRHGVSPYDYSPSYQGSSAIREAISGCFDPFAWNDFFTAGGNDYCECGLLDRDYYGGAMAASFAALNRYPTSYWGAWGFPGQVGARVYPVFEAYGSGGGPHSWVQGLSCRSARTAVLFPLDPLYRDERFGTWTVQYGYANFLTEEKLLERGRVREDGLLEAGLGTYRALVVPYLTFPREATLDLLERFARAGGSVVWCSTPPVLSREGRPVGDRWASLVGARPLAPAAGRPACEVRFEGDLASVRPMKVPSELPIDRVWPVEPLAGARPAARADGDVVGVLRTLGAGKVAYLGCRLRDDQSRSTGEDVMALTEVLQALGAFERPDAAELVSRKGPVLATRFRNGAISIANHYREIAEDWDGGFFRDEARDAKSLAGKTLPLLDLVVKDLAVEGLRVSYRGTGCLSFRKGPSGLEAFAGSGTTGVEVDGRRWDFTGAPADVAFAPLPAERLPEGFAGGFQVRLGAVEAALPIRLVDARRARAFRDVFGDGRRLEPAVIALETLADGTRIKLPALLAGAPLVVLEAAAPAAAGPASREEAPAASARSLAGEWSFRLDPDDAGVAGRWFASDLPERVRLPGSTDENGKGTLNTKKPTFDWLYRLHEYTGPAWYAREVDVPEAWRGKRDSLFLERCHWESRAWVDGREAGMEDSLSTPHVHQLGGLAPGKHRIAVRIDNRMKYDVGKDAHSVSDQTQTNWNGAIGRIELRAADPVRIEEVQVYPDPERRAVKVRLTVANETGAPARGRIDLRVTADGAPPAEATIPLDAPGVRTTLERELALSAGAPLWDEFAPALHTLQARLTAEAAGTPSSDERTARFGLRRLSAEGKRLVLNGRRIYLRGTLECCIFPLTGYPAMDVDGWLRIVRIAKAHGLNHLRFHSWCPPEAAFEAADREGFLYHVEAPQWTFDVGKVPLRDRFIEEEVRRILDTYGNHPSFGMLCLGNELQGDPAFLARVVRMGKERDPRHLYTSSTAWSFTPEDQYDVAVVRGLRGPGTLHDFRAEVEKSRVPVVSHEIGQWAVYPNLAETAKYTGVLRARNFDLVREDLERKGMLDLAPAFTRATGKFSALLYKEEMEVLLRTPGHSGFQLLDLHDFPGQGTALVGVLDPFWDSKGILTPEEHRRYCGPTVPLVRLKGRTFTAGETLAADVEVAHFGPAAIEDPEPRWALRDDGGREVAAGRLPCRTIPTGELTPLGRIEAPLAGIAAPAHLRLVVSLKGGENDWSVWVYPDRAGRPEPADIVVRASWDAETRAALAAGRKVLLDASSGVLARSLPGSFAPVFWSPVWFQGTTGTTMGVLCDPAHPALRLFPTAEHADWQWYDLLSRSKAAVLDDLPPLSPIVRIIDNFSRNHRLAAVFEARVGEGRLLVSGIDVTRDMSGRPAARALRESLLAYMASADFHLPVSLDEAAAARLFREPPELKEEAPAAGAEALLDVRAAAALEVLDQPAPWSPKADVVAARADGFGYTVRGGVWKDAAGSAWHDGGDLAVRVTCPKGFEGKFYVHIDDWNQLGRVAEVSFQGKEVLTAEGCGVPGKWFLIPVRKADTVEGRLDLSLRPTHANAMVGRIVVTR